MRFLPFRRSIPVASALVAGFAGGWSFKEPAIGVPAAIAPPPVVSGNQKPGPHGRDQVRNAWAIASDGETVSGSMPAPFTSLDELVELIAGFDLFDEASGVELMTSLPRLFTTDLPTTRRLLDELGSAPGIPKNASQMIAMTLMARWMMQEPESAVLYGQCHPGLIEADTGGEFASFGLALLARRDPDKARSMLSILPEDKREDAEELLTMCAALNDPATYLTTTPLEDIENGDEMVAAWARRDPLAAAQWVLSQTGSEEGDTDDAIAAVAAGWAHKDRDGALAWVASLPSGNAKAEAYRHLAEIITEGMSCEEAAPLLTAMPPEVADRILLSLAGNGESVDSPDTVAEILTRHASDEEFQKESSGSASRVARSLAASGDGPAAAAWVARLPDGEARMSAAEAVANEWAGKDAVAASEWVASLPVGETRSRAVVGLIEKIAGNDPESALAWSVSLPAGGLCNEQAGKVLRGWLPDDPYAAMTALEALPEEVRSAIWKTEE